MSAYDALLLVIALACIGRIWIERRAHDRELLDKRNRLYRGWL